VANPACILVQQLFQVVDHQFAWSSESSLLERSAQPSEMPHVLQRLRCLQTAWSAIRKFAVGAPFPGETQNALRR
jgi:hypothetical protein